MQRADVIAELGAVVRRDHWSAGFAVGYLAQGADTELLEELLNAVREQWPANTAPAHLEAYRERWAPGRRRQSAP